MARYFVLYHSTQCCPPVAHEVMRGDEIQGFLMTIENATSCDLLSI